MPKEKLPPKAYRMTTFYVRGSGTFPFDMLRYDVCVPATGDDAYAMASLSMSSLGEERIVKLNRFSQDGTPPSFDRWRRFTWEPLTEAQYQRELEIQRAKESRR